MKIPFHPLSEIFPLLEDSEFNALVEDIRTHGLMQPIVVFENKILDGRNRYRACQEANVTPDFDEYGGDDALAFVLSLNLKRRHLNESQRAMVAARLETMKRGRPGKDANLHVSRPEAATSLNVSERSVASAAVVRDHAAPELRKAVDQGKLAVSEAAKAARLPMDQQLDVAHRARDGDANAARSVIKQAMRGVRETELAAKQTALPDKRYGVIVADPEWRFEPYSRGTGMDRAADNHYPTSDLEAIKQRDVASIAADDCVLFLWATAPMLPQALDVMAAWGFVYKSQAIWVKDRIGTGYWFRNQHELLLVGVKGSIPAPAPGTQGPSVISAPVRSHSEKPGEALDLIDKYFPSLAKIELNARAARLGWDCWGYEAPRAEAAE